VAALPNNVEMLTLLAGTQLAAGENNQAIASYSKLASLQPKSPVPLLGLAAAQMATKSFDAAAQTVKQAAAIAPDSQAVVQLGAQLDILASRPEAALAKARAMQNRLPKAADGFVIEGDIASSQGNWKSAITAYRTALQREPKAELIAQRLYRALRATGDQARTDAFAAEWERDNPGDAEFPFFLAGLAMGDRKYDMAEAQLKRSLLIAPENPWAANNLAWVLSAQGKPEALEAAERANALAPNQPELLDTLAKILTDQGQLARALTLQQKAVDVDPNSPGLRLRLARLYIDSGNKTAARKELEILEKLGNDFRQQQEVRALLSKL
jgi:putative PEP-CTERM system TPR-repeat lipoprotein